MNTLNNLIKLLGDIVRPSTFVIGYFFCSVIQCAYASEQINLILPLRSDDHAQLAQKLESGLKSYGLDNIKVQYADLWHNYQQGIRTGKHGIYFTAPHFAAWATNIHGFKPLAKIAEPISYVITAKEAHPEVFEINDLINRTICSKQPLEQDYVFLTDTFAKKYGSFNHHFLSDVQNEMLTKKSSCDGFVISNHVLKSMLQSGNRDYIRLYQSKTYNNYAFIAHPNIDPETSAKLTSFLVDPESVIFLKLIVSRYAKDLKLVRAGPDDYPESYANRLKIYWLN